MRNLLKIGLLGLFLGLAGSAGAQQAVLPCFKLPAPSTSCVQVSAANPLPTSATISGTGATNITQVGGGAVSSGQLPVVGNVASATSDSGNPVKIGGVFNVTPPVLTDKQRGDVQLDSSARQVVVIQGPPPSLSGVTSVTNSIVPTVGVISASAKLLYAVSATSITGTGTLALYDNASACSGTIRWSSGAAASTTLQQSFVNPIAFTNGISGCFIGGTSALVAVVVQ